MQRTPAGLPSGMPGIGDEMEGAIQQAAHLSRHRGAFSGLSGFFCAGSIIERRIIAH